MKQFSLLTLLVVMAVSAFGQNWSVDKSHSRLGFKTTHMGITEFHGNFKDYTAMITPGKAGFEGATIDVSINTNSINTENDYRDGDLRSENYFNVEKYPTITYKSGAWKKTGDKTYVAEGDLTLNGVTKKVKVDIKVTGTMTNQRNKKEMAGVTMTANFKRSDFNFAPGTPDTVVGDDITLYATGEFTK